MSIQELIKDAVDHDRLHWVDPIMPGDRVVRRVLVTPEIWRLIDQPEPRWRQRCSRLRADIESFVRGDEISVSLTPFKAGNAYLGLLAPPQDGVWDIRSRDPSPALRLLGHFAERDLFVATVIASRSVPFEPVVLGPLEDKESDEWARAIRIANAEWRKLFHSYPHSFGGDVREILTSEYNIV